jgi:hypothetical protein
VGQHLRSVDHDQIVRRAGHRMSTRRYRTRGHSRSSALESRSSAVATRGRVRRPSRINETTRSAKKASVSEKPAVTAWLRRASTHISIVHRISSGAKVSSQLDRESTAPPRIAGAAVAAVRACDSEPARISLIWRSGQRSSAAGR